MTSDRALLGQKEKHNIIIQIFKLGDVLPVVIQKGKSILHMRRVHLNNLVL